MSPATQGSRELKRARAGWRTRAWADAFDAFSRADEKGQLNAEDLERLAVSAYLVGREGRFQDALSRAHAAYVEAGDTAAAIRCAFWLGLTFLLSGETGRGSGWLSAAGRLAERDNINCAETGYLLLPKAEQLLAAGDHVSAHAAASEAIEIGDRFDDADLTACARHLQGKALIGEGRVEEGLALLDEAMLAVSSGRLFPLMTGLIYCSVIEACRDVYAFARAREWTDALAEWCETQPQMVAFSTACLVHRAEIMQLHGAWPDAIREAQRACGRRADADDDRPPASALYRQAELYRLRGDFERAESAYISAGQLGYDPLPGLALLRLAQGRAEDAETAIRRGLGGTSDIHHRTRLLPAYVEIMLHGGQIEEAGKAGQELDRIADRLSTEVLGAIAAQAMGAIELADGNSRRALGSLRRAFEIWQKVDAPYEAARVRELAGVACRALGDNEGASLEFEAARATFERLGAKPDLARLRSLTREPAPVETHGLTKRELQVLELVAAGKTNKGIAVELNLSERTVDRHVSNIFDKLDVPSRAAATAYAFQHKLL